MSVDQEFNFNILDHSQNGFYYDIKEDQSQPVVIYQFDGITNEINNPYSKYLYTIDNLMNEFKYDNGIPDEIILKFDNHSSSFEHGLVINSTNDFISYGDYNIPSDTIFLPNEKLLDLAYLDDIRNNAGFEIRTTFQDDYIDLSGYEVNEFFEGIKPWDFDFEISPGNDIYIGPEFLNPNYSYKAHAEIDASLM